MIWWELVTISAPKYASAIRNEVIVAASVITPFTSIDLVGSSLHYYNLFLTLLLELSEGISSLVSLPITSDILGYHVYETHNSKP